MSLVELELSPADEDTILQYKIDVERKRGYFGPSVINLDRLQELHMENAASLTQVYLFQLKYRSRISD